MSDDAPTRLKLAEIHERFGRIAAKMLGRVDAVCDIGCGPLMPLRSLLPTGTAYFPADLTAWSASVERCDLAAGLYPKSAADTDVIVMLGLAQYLPDPKAVLAHLATLNQRLIFDYITSSSAHEDDPQWLTRWDADHIRKVIAESQWTIVAERPLAAGHLIFDLRSNVARPAGFDRGLPTLGGKLYWYDEVENFGDIIGPWLFETVTGRRPTNVRLPGGTSNEPGLLTIGSLLHEIDRPGHAIWGTGLICPVDEWIGAKLQGAAPTKVYAIRGKLTERELRDHLGWQVPSIYGDPALLLPRFYDPRPSPEYEGRIALLPHYAHRQYFENLPLNERFALVSAQQHPSRVIDSIVSSELVISTSLHGAICAHAYGKPWVSLQLADHELVGGSFKFDDFFSNLDDGDIPGFSIKMTEISNNVLLDLANFAGVPRTISDLDALASTMPFNVIA